MPYAMYFSGNKETFTKINQVPYQVIEYDDKGMFQAKLMENTQAEIYVVHQQDHLLFSQLHPTFPPVWME